MHLTPSEELILHGERGYVLQKAMEILAALGDIYDADRLIPIWRELSISEEFAAKQEEVIRAYENLGILPWCTCTPYEIRADLAMPGMRIIR